MPRFDNLTCKCGAIRLSSQNPGCLGFLMRLFSGGPGEAQPVSNGQPTSAEFRAYRVADSILTASELAFYRVLRQAVGNTYTITCKARLGDVFAVVPKNNYSALNRIQSKHVDFLLCDPVTMRPVAGIELDGWSHKMAKEQARDQFKDDLYRVTGLPLVRIPDAGAYDVSTVRAQIDAEIHRGARGQWGPTGTSSGAPATPTPIVGQRPKK
jgi:hypothetical protein